MVHTIYYMLAQVTRAPPNVSVLVRDVHKLQLPHFQKGESL